MVPILRDIIRASNAEFVRLEEDRLWYSVDYLDNEGLNLGWEFPIPVNETQDGIFLANEKPILFLPWIREQICFLQAQEQQLRDDERQRHEEVTKS